MVIQVDDGPETQLSEFVSPGDTYSVKATLRRKDGSIVHQLTKNVAPVVPPAPPAPPFLPTSQQQTDTIHTYMISDTSYTHMAKIITNVNGITSYIDSGLRTNDLPLNQRQLSIPPTIGRGDMLWGQIAESVQYLTDSTIIKLFLGNTFVDVGNLLWIESTGMSVYDGTYHEIGDVTLYIGLSQPITGQVDTWKINETPQPYTVDTITQNGGASGGASGGGAGSGVPAGTTLSVDSMNTAHDAAATTINGTSTTDYAVVQTMTAHNLTNGQTISISGTTFPGLNDNSYIIETQSHNDKMFLFAIDSSVVTEKNEGGIYDGVVIQGTFTVV